MARAAPMRRRLPSGWRKGATSKMRSCAPCIISAVPSKPRPAWAAATARSITCTPRATEGLLPEQIEHRGKCGNDRDDDVPWQALPDRLEIVVAECRLPAGREADAMEGPA